MEDPTRARESSAARLKRLVKRWTGAASTIDGVPGKSILLTFDDGPHPEMTPRVLSLLAQYHARAVFFVVGNRIPRAPHLLRAILEQGHALGNHSFAHANGGPMPMPAYVADIRRCQRAVADLTGREPRLFRPPQGRLSCGSIAAAHLLRLRTLLWSVDTGDWRIREPEAAQRRARELEAAFRGADHRGNDIVLMHDDNACSVDLLRDLLPALTALGYDLSGPFERIRA